MDGRTASVSSRLRAAAGELLRRTADKVDGTSASADLEAVEVTGADGSHAPAERRSGAKRRRAFAKPLASLQGYELENLPHDVAAGAVVAALSIPIAMGYAEVIGLPAIYGLYTSIIAPLVFALVTGTRRIVFGMDSAVAAVTGSMLVSCGLVSASGDVSAAIPLVTILTGVFLALFSVLGAGRLARFIPIPVMHGFIAGVSLTVIVTQLPGLIGTTADMSGGFISDVVAAFGSIAEANGPSTLIAAISLGLIVHLKRTMPRVPAALVVLVLTTVMCAVLHLDEDGVSVLGAIDAGLPVPVAPSLEGVDVPAAVLCALVIAVVASIESLLCLETFSMKAGVRPDGNRELLSFGIGNAAAGIFGCPPCSASLSRTAAGISAGSRTQATSIAAAVIVAAVVLVLSPTLYYLPRPALSAIVVMALIDVVDFDKAARYARHMMLEFVVFLVSAVVVLAFGAIAGVVAGTVASLLVAFYRDRRSDQHALLGVAYDEDAFGKKKAKPKVGYAALKLEGHLTFLNIDAKIDALLDEMDETTRAVVVKLNKVDSLDSTAADKLILLVDMLHARHIHVKIVRKVRPTNDSITRYEMRRIMRGAKFYPTMRAALAGLARDLEREAAAQKTGADDSIAPGIDRRAALATAGTGAPLEGVAHPEAARAADAHGNALPSEAPGMDEASATGGRAAAVLADVGAGARNLVDRIAARASKEEPFSVLPDDRIVMTVQDAQTSTGDADLEGKLAYIRAREAVLFEVDLARDAPGAQDSDAAHDGVEESAAAADSTADKADKKTRQAKPSAKPSGKNGAGKPGEKSTKKASKKKAPAEKRAPSQVPYAAATLRREKTGEVLAEYRDGSWRWNYPEEMLEPAVDLIEELARDARR